LELAPRIVIIEDVVGRIFSVDSFAVTAFYNMYAIVFTIKKCVNITHCSPFVAGWALLHARDVSDS
jgi:hypothetical protein